MTAQGDQELHRRFRALRQEDRAGAPSFGATRAALERRRARPRAPVVAWVFAGAAALLLVVLLRLPERGPRSVDLASVSWEGPTDFLLELPGADLLRTVPELWRLP